MSEKIDFNSKIDLNKKGNTISAEEAVNAFMSGQGSLSQVKQDDDGTKHFFNVYGPVPDGLDHILNIFIDSDSLSAVFSAIVNNKLKKTEKKDDNKYDGSQITIDFTDKPIMWVFKDTKEKLFLDAYQRDEKKSFDFAGITNAWDKQDGTITITGEKIQEDNCLYYAAIFGSLANHLAALGLVDKLRELNKYSGAGILVSAKDEDNITARIVQGKERPDLPCEVFLMGTITCRPYLDEMLASARVSRMSMDEKVKAAKDGDAEAMEALAKAFLEGDGVLQDYKQSFHWWKELAETGNATAQFNTGLYYAKGCGVKRDFAKAAEWMQKAADNGDKDAANAVSAYKSAGENLQKAQLGDAAAQAELAKLYTQMGNSLEQLDVDNDYKEAFKWAKESADQGNVDGLYILALCYEHGRGTTFDYEKANKAYEEAAKKGHAPSQWNLACHYLRGFGDNDEEGLMLAYQAADQGYELAIKGIEESGNTVEKLKEFYEDKERIITLEATQYEGRADRCERIHPGDELTYKIVKDKYGRDALEMFYRGGTVGLVYRHSVGKIIALLKMNRAKLKVTVRTCIPKSKRGARARNADVTLNMILTEIKPETPEEKAARLEKEKVEKEKQKEKERKEYEARKKAEEEKRKAEEERRKKEETLRQEKEKQRKLEEERIRKAAEEAKAKAEAERLAFEKSREEARINQKQALDAEYEKIETQRLMAISDQEASYKDELKKLEEEISGKTAKINKLRSELAALGGMQFKRKKEIDLLIKDNEDSIAKLGTAKNTLEAKNESRKKEINASAERSKNEAIEDIRKRYPIPETPEEKEARKKEEELAEKKRLEEQEKLKKKEEEQRQKEQNRIAEENRRRAKRKKRIIGVCVVAALAAVLIYLFVVQPEIKYRNARADMENEKYDEATAQLIELKDYKESEEKIVEIEHILTYKEAEEALNKGDYDTAEKLFKNLGDFSDSSSRVEDAVEARNADLYKQAEKRLAENDLDGAQDIFEKLGGYSDSSTRVEGIIEIRNNNQYKQAELKLEDNDLDGAQEIFEKLGGYSDSEQRVKEIIEKRNQNTYKEAEEALEKKDYDKAEQLFIELGDYSDASNRVQDVVDARNQDTYEQAILQFDSENYEEAQALFASLGDYLDAKEKADESQQRLNEQLYARAEEQFYSGNYKEAKENYEKIGDYLDAGDKAAQASAALKEQEELAELREAWDGAIFFPSRQGGFFTFEFEWGEGASTPAAYFTDGAGRHGLTVQEISKSKSVLYDSRGVTHTLTRKSSGDYNWRWESTSGISFY